MASNDLALDNGIERIHPLQNHLIYEELFKHVSKSCWKSCRLVCSPWHDELLERFRNQTTVHIGDSSQTSLRPVTSRRFLNCTEFLSDYQTDPYQFRKYPFRHVEAGNFSLDAASCNFWTLCGPWLHSLHLNRVFIKCNESFRRLVQEWTPNLKQFEYTYCELEDDFWDPSGGVSCPQPALTQPSLTSCTLSVLEKYRPMGISRGFPMSWEDFFRTFPNLETLILQDLGNDLWQKVEDILSAINTIRRDVGFHVLNIKHFDAIQNGTVNLEDGACGALNYLRGIEIPLETLKLSVHQEIYRDEFARLLRAHQYTMKHLYLKLDGPCGRDYVSTFLPNQLTILELIRPVCESWNFLRFTPNLMKLVVNRSLHDDDDEISLPSEALDPIEGLKTFEYKTKVAVSAENLTFFGRVMPAVRTLLINVNCAGFRQLCDQWRGMEELELYKGIVCEQTFVQRLTLLSRLKSVCFMYGQKSPMFGDLSISHGFLKLPLLKHLEAAFSANTGEEILEQLKSRLDDESNVTKHDGRKVQWPFRNVGCDGICHVR